MIFSRSCASGRGQFPRGRSPARARKERDFEIHPAACEPCRNRPPAEPISAPRMRPGHNSLLVADLTDQIDGNIEFPVLAGHFPSFALTVSGRDETRRHLLVYLRQDARGPPPGRHCFRQRHLWFLIRCTCTYYYTKSASRQRFIQETPGPCAFLRRPVLLPPSSAVAGPPLGPRRPRLSPERLRFRNRRRQAVVGGRQQRFPRALSRVQDTSVMPSVVGGRQQRFPLHAVEPSHGPIESLIAGAKKD